ncbi:hypothetical protein [Phaffia rhodozyma]|uniref:Uncharacterized protein n=1 Tax=Phaffia rhodozyma TaxID=264483 RepID=A0A0F7SSX9_PHARH|nr:hypothetical protein [Phaffia rhodozyma]
MYKISTSPPVFSKYNVGDRVLFYPHPSQPEESHHQPCSSSTSPRTIPSTKPQQVSTPCTREKRRDSSNSDQLTGPDNSEVSTGVVEKVQVIPAQYVEGGPFSSSPPGWRGIVETDGINYLIKEDRSGLAAVYNDDEIVSLTGT